MNLTHKRCSFKLSHYIAREYKSLNADSAVSSSSSVVFSGPNEKRMVPAGYVPNVLCAFGAQ